MPFDLLTFLYAISNNLREDCCKSLVTCLIFSGVSFSLFPKTSFTLVICSLSLSHWKENIEVNITQQEYCGYCQAISVWQNNILISPRKHREINTKKYWSVHARHGYIKTQGNGYKLQRICYTDYMYGSKGFSRKKYLVGSEHHWFFFLSRREA